MKYFPLVYGSYGSFQIGSPRQQNSYAVAEALANLPQESRAVHFRHVQVRNYDGKRRRAGQFLQRLGSARCSLHAAEAFEVQLERFQNARIVVDTEHARRSLIRTIGVHRPRVRTRDRGRKVFRVASRLTDVIRSPGGEPSRSFKCRHFSTS